ncbi:low molecular weight protein-tyrosine-phosphatase [Povalibacter sp.]|uniref:low molecular weight protein-tyrosine-phosphatase n=1 Tax=Povalibacter sp. TaxID=1962978 RepID=UPI002F41715B
MRILFVCLGNICRSPTAEGVFRRLLMERQLEQRFEVDSAGTHDYHVGKPPDARSIAAARRRGIDLSGLRARAVDARDAERFDLILAMDDENLDELRRRFDATYHHRLALMMSYAPDARTNAVPDPYYGGERGFEEVLDLLEQAAEGLLSDLLSRDANSK